MIGRVVPSVRQGATKTSAVSRAYFSVATKSNVGASATLKNQYCKMRKQTVRSMSNYHPLGQVHCFLFLVSFLFVFLLFLFCSVLTLFALPYSPFPSP